MPADSTPHRLICHPQTPCGVVSAIDFGLEPSPGGGLDLRYRLYGEIARLRLPPACAPGAADGLWQHCCCEIFIGSVGAVAYAEFNLSPSGQWAAYAFRACRERDAVASAQLAAGLAPAITTQIAADCFELSARLPASRLPPAPQEIGVAVVVEAIDGTLSYWALRHSAAQPDFHARDAFTLRLDTAAESIV